LLNGIAWPDDLLLSIDLDNMENFEDDLSTFSRICKTLPLNLYGFDEDQLTGERRLTVSSKVVNFLKKSVELVRVYLPIEDKTMRAFRVLDPKEPTDGDQFHTLLKRFSHLIPDNDPNTLVREFEAYKKSDVVPNVLSLSIDAFWANVGKNVRYQSLSAFMLNILCLPHSTSEVERIFSVVSGNKTKERNRLNTDTLEAILIVKGEVSDLANFYPSRDMIRMRKEAKE
jgi:hypothetical protein